MTACGPEDNEFAGLKTAEAEDAVVVPGFTAGQIALIDLNAVEVSDELDVQAFTVPATALPEGVELAKAEVVFEDGTVLPATVDGKVSGNALSQYVASLYGLRPESHSVVGNVYLYAIQNGAAVKIDAGKVTFNVVPKAPEIEANYYITGSVNGWDNSDKTYLVTNDGSDPYENPIFSITVGTDVLGGNALEFKLTPESGIGGDWSKCLCAANEEGKFNYNNEGGNFLVPAPSPEAKYLRLTFNMLDKIWTYEYIAFDPFVYFIGATDGWQASDQKVASQGEGKYTGYVYIADPNGWGVEFKFQKRPGDWADDSQLNSNNMNSVTGDFAKTGDNFKAVPGEGVYYVELDLAAGSLKGTYINNMNLVGDYNGWNAGDDAQQMTWNAEEFCYEITGAGVTANGWKFTTNNSWDINLGGTINNLVANGDNLSVVGTKIKLYPTRKTSDNIYCTVE
jgi:hypothetical protein